MPAQRISSQEKAYRFLKSAILDLEFRPNARLRTETIASRIHLSRTPIREALSRLEQEGLVLRDHGSGYVVRSITVKEAIDIYEVREVLEVKAVRAAIPRITRDLSRQLASYLRKAADRLRQGKLREYRDNIRAFNLAIARGTDNSYLEFLLSLMADRIRWLGAMIADCYPDYPRESLDGNRKVLAALAAGDQAAAKKAVRKHVSRARDSFMRYVIADSRSPRDRAGVTVFPGFP